MLGALIAKGRVREGFGSLMRGDLDTYVSLFSQDAVVSYPTRGDIKGRAAIREFFQYFIDTFPKREAVISHIGVENIFDLIGTNVLLTRFHVITTNRQGVAFKQEGMQLIRIRRGQLIYLQYFFQDTERLRQAWKESTPPAG